ncbi:hypothetical protein QE152_g37195 [Popillia japonica]|uniref:Retroviral polymerase SH3-like domain-containing protein n=1 Tax=Popillia japonica TaxID=7064 RepID=A0AAW1IAY8_POPJA
MPCVVQDKADKTRFQRRAEKYIIVGYTSESKAYRIYNSAAIKIILARDVVFDEDTIPAKKWKRHTPEKPKQWVKIYILKAADSIPENSRENLVRDVVDSAKGS